MLDALHEPFSVEERLWIIEEALDDAIDYGQGLGGDPHER